MLKKHRTIWLIAALAAAAAALSDILRRSYAAPELDINYFYLSASITAAVLLSSGVFLFTVNETGFRKLQLKTEAFLKSCRVSFAASHTESNRASALNIIILFLLIIFFTAMTLAAMKAAPYPSGDEWWHLLEMKLMYRNAQEHPIFRFTIGNIGAFNTWLIINSFAGGLDSPALFAISRIISFIALLTAMLAAASRASAWFGRAAPALAAFFFIIHPGLSSYSHIITEDSFFILLVFAIFLLVTHQDRRTYRFAAAGLLTALATGARSAGIIMVIPSVLSIFQDRKTLKRNLFMFLLFLAVGISPIIYASSVSNAGPKGSSLLWLLMLHGPQIAEYKSLFSDNINFSLPGFIAARFSLMTVGDIVFGLFSVFRQAVLPVTVLVFAMILDSDNVRRRITAAFFIVSILFLSQSVWKGGDSAQVTTMAGAVGAVFVSGFLVSPIRVNGSLNRCNLSVKLILFLVLICHVLNPETRVLLSKTMNLSPLADGKISLSFFDYELTDSEKAAVEWIDDNTFEKNNYIFNRISVWILYTNPQICFSKVELTGDRTRCNRTLKRALQPAPLSNTDEKHRKHSYFIYDRREPVPCPLSAEFEKVLPEDGSAGDIEIYTLR